MKRIFAVITVLSICIISSCKSSFEKDTRKMGNLICKEEQLSRKAMLNDENAKKELEKVQEERDKLKDELSEKYKDLRDDDEKREKVRKIINGIMKECK